MEDQEQTSDIVPKKSYNVQLSEFEQALLNFLNQQDLPTESIFVPVSERMRVFNNVDSTVILIDNSKRQRSMYISKFIAAAASGLFDAALNYLWDETISELRQRVAQYDIAYFYDNAVGSERRKDLKSVDDLNKIDDFSLIRGSKEIGLISPIGFSHLDHIRNMRNWASAAHPNQNEITGLQLVTWLETCVKEVISLPLSSVVVDIKRLLHNVKTNNVSEAEAREISVFFLKLNQEQINNLASGFFGIYTRSDANSTTQQNVHRLLPLLWNRVDEQTRHQFGVKYGKFVADNDQVNVRFARQFLELVSALPYMPEVLRAAEIETALENLLAAHREFNNFYNEPPFARQLQRLIGPEGKIPSQINIRYVFGLVEVFLTNGNGVARNAEPIYRSLIDLFDSKQAFIAIMSFTNDTISSKLQSRRCGLKYQELLEVMKIKVSLPPVKELIEDIERYSGRFDELEKDPRFKQKVNNIAKILNISISL
jgi:hypothetical protein